MGVQERKAREKEELRQEILDAARDLFVELGYEAVSMRRIAEKIEYSPTTIYLHFRDKSDLLDCICSDTFSRLVDLLEAISRTEPSPVAALKRGLRAYIDFGLEHPAQYRVAFMMPDAHHCDPEHPSRSDEAGQRAFSCLVATVAACAHSGALHIPNVELTAQMLWTSVHGLTSLLISAAGFRWADREDLINHLLDTLTKGLEKP
jgi:AcrR family transcriptional regulator